MPPRPKSKDSRAVARRPTGRRGVRVPKEPPEDRRRTPLPHTGGDEILLGDQYEARVLSACFRVDEHEEELPIRGVHGLHPYPARFHPAWARRILAGLPEKKRVLDPFCGSGTVLVESLLSGRQARGSDLNEVALRIARYRATRRTPAFLKAFRTAAQEASDASTRRRESQFGVLARGKPPYAPHVLAQLITLRDSIQRLSVPPDVKEAVLMTGSSLLGNFASRTGREAPEFSRRAVRDHFLRRARQAVEAWSEFAEWVPPEMREVDIRHSDARWLPWKPESVDAIITSPPYPGVYDYGHEQAWRARWLGDDEWLEHARTREIGKRGSSAEHWSRGVMESIHQMARAVRPEAPIYLVMGDGAVYNRAIRVRELLNRIDSASDFPIEPVAAVGQVRPHFHGPSAEAFRYEPRREYLILLKRK